MPISNNSDLFWFVTVQKKALMSTLLFVTEQSVNIKTDENTNFKYASNCLSSAVLNATGISVI